MDRQSSAQKQMEIIDLTLVTIDLQIFSVPPPHDVNAMMFLSVRRKSNADIHIEPP